MSYAKVMLGTKYPKKVKIPNIDTIVEHSENESVLFFGHINSKGKTFRQFWAIGAVVRVLRNETYDLLIIKFGDHCRKVVVADNHARRQLLTVKSGEYAQIFGVAKAVRNKYTTKDGEYKDYIKYYFYALAIQGMFVPSLVEIKRKKMKIDDKTVADYDIENEENKSYIDFIDELKEKL